MAQRTYLQNKNRVTDVKKTSCGYQGGKPGTGWRGINAEIGTDIIHTTIYN